MAGAPWSESKQWHRDVEVVPGRRLWVLLPPALRVVRPTEVIVPPTGQATLRARFESPVALAGLRFAELSLEASVSWTEFRRDAFEKHGYWVTAGVLAEAGHVRLPWRPRRVRAAAGPVGFRMGGAVDWFTPADALRWRGLPFAAGHPLTLACARGVLGEALSIGGVELPAGTAVEIDPDDGSALEARLATPMVAYGHEVPADAFVGLSRGPTPRSIVVGTSTGRWTIAPDGTRRDL